MMGIQHLNDDEFLNTNDVVKGDVILFEESVFEGSFRKPQHIGFRRILAEVLKESYGAEKQQHTFTLKVLDVEGVNAKEILDKKTIRRKGRNIYKNGVKRMIWECEDVRCDVAHEKHKRGVVARNNRKLRKEKEI